MKRILVTVLVYQLFTLAMPGLSPGSGYRVCQPAMADTIQKKQKKSQVEKGREKSGKIEEVVCPLKYLVYFFWYSFVIIIGVVVFVADLTTGFTEKFTKKYIKKVKLQSKKIAAFFNRFGCRE